MEITAQKLKKEIKSSQKPILVEFWSSWCPPCQMMSPILKNLQEQFKKEIKIFKVNADQNPACSEKYKIKGLPTFILFNGAKEVDRKIGAQSQKELENLIKNHIESEK